MAARFAIEGLAGSGSPAIHCGSFAVGASLARDKPSQVGSEAASYMWERALLAIEGSMSAAKLPPVGASLARDKPSQVGSEAASYMWASLARD